MSPMLVGRLSGDGEKHTEERAARVNSGSFPAIGREVGKGLEELSKNHLLLASPLPRHNRALPGGRVGSIDGGIRPVQFQPDG